MAVAVVCPACGKRFRVEDGLVGKRLRCPCGQRLEVHLAEGAGQPGSAPTSPGEDDDWVAAAFASSEPEPGQASVQEQEPLPPPMPLPAAQENRPDTWVAPTAQPAGLPGDTSRDLLRHLQSALSPAGKRWSKAAIQRLAVAVLAMMYGSVLAVVFVVRFFRDPPAGIFAVSNWIAAVVLAGCVAAGGWLILKRHPQGPAWAGLASVFLCFPTAWWLLLKVLGYYSAGQWRWLAAALVQGALLFGIPGVIVAWCLKKEHGRQQRERQQEETEQAF